MATFRCISTRDLTSLTSHVLYFRKLVVCGRVWPQRPPPALRARAMRRSREQAFSNDVSTRQTLWLWGACMEWPYGPRASTSSNGPVICQHRTGQHDHVPCRAGSGRSHQPSRSPLLARRPDTVTVYTLCFAGIYRRVIDRSVGNHGRHDDMTPSSRLAIRYSYITIYVLKTIGYDQLNLHANGHTVTSVSETIRKPPLVKA